MGLFDFIDICMTEDQARECAKSGVIYTPYIPLQVTRVMVKTPTTLHPSDCDCMSCFPAQTVGRRYPYGPSQSRIVPMAPGEDPPEGWKRTGA